MKRIFLSLCFLSSFLLSANLLAQQPDQNVIIIKSVDDSGTITVKKKRLEKGQSPTEYVDDLNLDHSKNIEITISSSGKENSSDGENLFFFKSNDGKSIKINGEGNWQEALIDMDFDFDDLHHMQGHHEKHHQKKENKVLLGVYPNSGEQGVEIDGIVVGSGADKAGLKKNDIMTAINGIHIRTSDDLHHQLATYEVNDVVVIDLIRDGQPMTISSSLTSRNNAIHRKSERDPCKVFFGVYVGNYGNGKQGVGVSGIIEGNDWPAEKAGLQ